MDEKESAASSIQARMLCSSVRTPYEGVEYVAFHAVYSSDPESPNFTYSQATPSAELRMTITNPDALGTFVEGKEYTVLFKED